MTEDDNSATLVIRPDGEIFDINLQSSDSTTLQQLREHIGCSTVDRVALTDRIDMWLDDEGLYTQPVNAPATALARHFGLDWQAYHGPAVICGADDEGGTTDLSRAQLVALRDILHTVAGR